MRRLILISLAVSMIALPLAAQTAAKKTYTPPKTSWGDPDLQGQWPATANIPMQRPVNMGTRAVLTDEEVAQRLKQRQQQDEGDAEEFVSDKQTVTINPPSYWVEHGSVNRQASLVIDPPNGRIPPLTAAGQAFVKAQRGGLGPGSHFPDKVDSWTDFDIYSRCITRGLLSSMLPTLYNFGNQIIQAPGVVVIRNEMIHEARIIPIDTATVKHPHVGKDVRTFMGDSRGHWEGNTLVVETTNFNNETGTSGAFFSDAAKIIERFTRTGPEDLVYEATIDDPKTWTAPWKLHMPYKLDKSYIVYEYACHEGNYMMLDALTAARQLDAQGKATKVDSDNFNRPISK